MRLSQTEVRLIHRLRGLRDGALTLQVRRGAVVQVAVDGRILAPEEWRPVPLFHVEQSEKKAGPLKNC